MMEIFSNSGDLTATYQMGSTNVRELCLHILYIYICSRPERKMKGIEKVVGKKKSVADWVESGQGTAQSQGEMTLVRRVENSTYMEN